jgi:hypothetical protein
MNAPLLFIAALVTCGSPEAAASAPAHCMWSIHQSNDILPTTFGEPGCDNLWRPGGIADTNLALLGLLALLGRLCMMPPDELSFRGDEYLDASCMVFSCQFNCNQSFWDVHRTLNSN